MALLDLDAVRDTRVSALPSGIRKQVELARVLVSPSSILLLDEPMLGLDTTMREVLWSHLLTLKSIEHKTILIATSRPEDAELCDRITVLNNGRVLAEGTVSRLRSMIGPEAVIIKPLGAKRPAGRGTWADKRAVVTDEQDGSLVVEMNTESSPLELLREISGQAAGVRLRPKGLGAVLEELIALSKQPTESREE
jgi:ABC-type multidrug transport system ATPase subunit